MHAEGLWVPISDRFINLFMFISENNMNTNTYFVHTISLIYAIKLIIIFGIKIYQKFPSFLTKAPRGSQIDLHFGAWLCTPMQDHVHMPHAQVHMYEKLTLLENMPKVHPKSTSMKMNWYLMSVHLHTGTFRVDGTYG